MKTFALVLLAAALLASVALVVRQYRRTAFVTPYALVVRTVEEHAVEGRRLGLTPVAVGTQRGLMRAPSAGHAWLLYWGGNSETYFKEAVDALVGLELPTELGVLIVAPPGYDSEGHPSPALIARSAVEARDWLRAQQGAETLVLGSFSMGCFSVYAAADAQVRGAAMVGVSDVLELNDADRLMRLRTPHRYELSGPAPAVPALIVQGALDTPEEAHTVAAWWGGARVVILPGDGHSESRTDAATRRELRAFFITRAGLSPQP